MVVGRYLAPRPDDEDFPPSGIIRRVFREFGLALVVGGLIVLLFIGYQLLGTSLTERHKQTQLQSEFNHSVALQAASATTTTLPTTTVPATTVPAATATTAPGSPATTAPPSPATTAPASAATTAPASATTVAGAPPTTAAGALPSTAAGGVDNPTVGVASAEASIPTGQAVDHLQIPAIGVDKYVVQGVSESDLMKGPGHYPQTVFPGQVGNAAIAGHRTTYGAPFFRLNGLKTGDRIIVTDISDHRYTYLVKSIKVVAPSDVAVLNPTRTAQLTLTTCNPRFSLTSRLVVVADISVPKKHVAKTATAATPTTTTTLPVPAPVPSSHLAVSSLGTGDRSARKPALIYGGALVLLWILTRVAVIHTRRWKRNFAYLIGVGGCLVVLWFAFENVVRLLPPNL